MSIISNKPELATSDLRKNALEILEAGLEAIQTEKILRNKLRVSEEGILEIDGYFLNLKSYNKIIFVGIGKCALDGAEAIEGILGNYLTDGMVIDVRDPGESNLKIIKYRQGTHPLPSDQNIVATAEILQMVKGLSENDLVLTLISGGGSALFELPMPGVTLEDIIAKTKELTAQGADIYELNRVRKEMSQVKGGKFAHACSPAQVISLLFSDVLGNDISVIASGPTVTDEPSEKIKNILVCSNIDALEAMESKASELGYGATIETDRFSGNAREKGKELAERPIAPKACVLMGGETTVKLPAPSSAEASAGKGGRNQELCLSALQNLNNDKLIISCSSDGFDNTDHAGALADGELLQKSRELNLNPEEFLNRSDSYNFFKTSGGAISTGRLGSNVADLVIILSN